MSRRKPSRTLLFLPRVATAIATVAMLSSCAPTSNHAALDATPTGIIGGQTATGHEDFSRSVVSLYDLNEDGFCTATLLSDSIAVTAGHCVESGNVLPLRLLFGKNLTDGSASAHEVDEALANPLYASHAHDAVDRADIGLIHFSGGLPPGYHAARLLDEPSALRNGASVLLVGYGSNDGVKGTGGGILRFVQTTIANAAFGKGEVLIDQTRGRGACHGDSGGPAYAMVDGSWLLWGLTSRVVNDPLSQCAVNAAFTSILHYRDWITATSQAFMAKHPPKSHP